jgi:hypothetical protein
MLRRPSAFDEGTNRLLDPLLFDVVESHSQST